MPLIVRAADERAPTRPGSAVRARAHAEGTLVENLGVVSSQYSAVKLNEGVVHPQQVRMLRTQRKDEGLSSLALRRAN